MKIQTGRGFGTMKFQDENDLTFQKQRHENRNIPEADKIIEFCEYIIKQIKGSKNNPSKVCLIETLEIEDLTKDVGDLVLINGVMEVESVLEYVSTDYRLHFELRRDDETTSI